jgi:hypothetical protein
MFGKDNGLPRRDKLDAKIRGLDEAFRAVQALEREWNRRYSSAESLSPRTADAVGLMKEARSHLLEAEAQRKAVVQELNRLHALRRQLDEIRALRERAVKAVPEGTSEEELRARLGQLGLEKMTSNDLVTAAVHAHEGARSGGVSQDMVRMHGSVAQCLAEQRDQVWKKYAEMLDAMVAVEHYKLVERETPERVERLAEQMKERGVL